MSTMYDAAKDCLMETTVITSKKSADSIKKLESLNKDRVGKTALAASGSEVKGSLVLDPVTYLTKISSGYQIVSYSPFDGEVNLIKLTNEEFQLLKKFR